MVSICSERAGSLLMLRTLRTAEDHDGQLCKLCLPSDPFKSLPAARSGKRVVEEDQVGKRELRSLPEFPFSLQVRGGLLPVTNPLNAAVESCLLKRPFHQFRVAFGIVHYQNRLLFDSHAVLCSPSRRGSPGTRNPQRRLSRLWPTSDGVNTPLISDWWKCHFHQIVAEQSVILLVDDREDDAYLVRRAFEKAGVTNVLQWVPSGNEAVQYLTGTGRYSDRMEYPLPELILLDLKMPGMDGFEVLEWLRRQQGVHTIPVLVLTSSHLIKDVNRAYSLGANSFLVKPLDFENYAELGRVIKEYWLQRSKAPQTFRPPPKPNDPKRKA